MRRLGATWPTRPASIVAAIAIAGGALAGCTSAEQTATTTTATAPTTSQSAPSVWSPVTNTTDASSDTAPPTTTPVIVTSETILGLSRDCTAAIRAQRAVTDLFSDALRGRTTPSGTAAPTTQATTEPSASTLSGITTSDVTRTFTAIEPIAPTALADEFATLQKVAATIAAATLAEVPEILAEPTTTATMTAITDFIATCAPSPSK